MSTRITKAELIAELKAAQARIAEFEHALGPRGGSAELGNFSAVEDALRKSQSLLAEVQQIGHIGHIEWSKTGKLLSCSDEMYEILGLPRGTVVNQHTIADMMDPDERKRLEEEDCQAFSHRRDIDYEYRIRRADGNERWLHQHSKVVYDEQGVPIRMIAIFQDVTEYKQAEEELQFRTARYRMAQTISHVGSWEYNLQTTHFWGSPEAKRIYGFDPDQADFSVDDVENCIPERERVHQALVDLIEAGKPYNLEFEIHPRDSSKPRIISSIAELQRDKHGNPFVVGVIQDITERKQVEQKLRESEERFSRIFRASPIGIILTQLEDGRILDVNNAFLEMFGREREKVVGNTTLALNFFPNPVDRTRLVSKLSERGRILGEETGFRHSSGKLGILYISAEVINLPNGQALLSMMVDITARRQAEQAIRLSEEKWRTLFETCPVGIALTTAQGEFLDANPAYLAQLGYTRDELAKKRYEDITPSKWHEQEAQNVAQLKAGGAPMYFEKEHIRKGGTVFPVALTGWVIRDESGAPSTMGVFVQDITERKQAEEALHESESRYRLLVETSIEGIWSMDREHRTTYVNQSMADMLGYEPSEMLGRKVEEFFFQEDMQFHQTRMEKRHSGQDEVYERRFRRRDGSQLWTLVSARVQKDSQGNFDGSFAMFTDITERKRAEDALRASEERFVTVFRSNPSAVAVVRLSDNMLLDINSAWENITGWPREDAIGKTPLELDLWVDPSEREQMKKLIAEHRAVYGFEMRLCSRSGTIIHLLMSAEIINLQGEPCMVTMAQDITERKREERYTQARLNLANLSYKTLDMDMLMRAMLDEAEALTDSQIGFFHFVDDDQSTINLQAWSTNTLRTLCTVEGVGQHYPVAQAGVWADGIRSGEPRIYNDYASLPNRRELPEGHAPVTRLISLPIKRNNLIVAAIGVGNKPADYNEHDLEMVKRLAEDAFDIVLRKRVEEALRESERRLSTLLSNLIGFAYRCRNDRSWSMTYISNGCLAITGYPSEDLIENRVLAYNDLIVPIDREMAWETIQNALNNREPYHLEYRIIDREGTEKWVWEQGRGVFEEGELKALEGFITDVTDRKRAEEALRESEERFRTVADFTYDLEYWLDENQQLVYISPSCERLTGYNRDDFARNPALLETIVHPDDRPLYDQHITGEFYAQAPGSLDFRITTSDGRERWVSHICQGVYNGDGKPRGRWVSIRDITERIKSEEQIHQQMEDLAFVNALNQAANRGESLERIMEILSAEGRRIFRCLDVAIYLLSPDGQSIVLQHGTLPEPLKNGIEKMLGRPIPKVQIPVLPGGFFHAVINSDMGVITSDPETLQHWMLEFVETPFLPDLVRPAVKALIPQIFKLLNIRSVITVPLKSENKTLGAIEISRGDPFSEHDLERLQNVRASLTEILKRKQVEQDLMASEEKYRGLMESLDSVVANVDINGVFLYMNDTAAEQLGGVPAQFIGKTMYELFPEYTASLQMRDIHTVFDTDQGMVFENPSLVNGKSRWYRTSIQPLHEENGQVVSVLINSTDIHDLKTAQQELQELNRTLEDRVKQRTAEVQDLYDNAPTGYHSLDVNGNFVLVNQTELNWLGYTREELVGHAALEFLTEESKNTFRENFPLFLRRGWLKDLELEFVCKDGSVLPVSLSATAIRDENGNFVMSRSTILDITERKQAENELKRNVNFISALLNSVPTPVFYKDRDGRYLGCNRAFTELTGKTPEEIIGKQPHQVWTTEHADIYRQKDIEMMQSGEIQVYESAIKDKDGKIRPVIFVKNAFLDESGKPAGLVGAFVDITERKESERILRESEETYRALFENSNDAIFLMSAVDGAFVKVNPRCAELLGYPAEELIGKNSTEFVDPLEGEDSQERWSRLFSGERMAAYERRLVRNGGEIVETDINLNLIRDAAGKPVLVQSVVRDITARKQAERALRESEEQNRLLFEESPVPIALLDEAGHIIHANHAYELLTGYPRSDLYGKTSEEVGLVDAQVINNLTKAMLEAMSKQENFAIMEHPLTSADGTRRIVESRIYLLQINSMNQILVTSNDITPHKRAEETLRLANRELERALRLKDEFLANMSHELRTPLNAILGISESLMEQIAGPLNDKQLKYTQTVHESGQHLLTLINDVLDLAKINAGKVELEMSRVEAPTIAQSCLRLVRELAQKKGLELTLDLDPAVSLFLADERRLKQMIVNLLSNAVKFTPSGGRVGLQIRGDASNRILHFSVWDTGIGIHPDEIQYLFQPFVQLNAGLARDAQGTGLGLVLVSQMARLHGGSVRVESQPGQGSRFTISIPWRAAAQTGSLSRAAQPNHSPAPAPEGNQRPTILLVEDTEAVSMLIHDYLESHGYHVFVARNGFEGITQAQQLHPKLILMDVMMPEMDGLETTRRLRSLPGFEHTPIIALTALAMPGDRERCLAAGMNDYLSKPVKLSEVLEIVQRYEPRHPTDNS